MYETFCIVLCVLCFGRAIVHAAAVLNAARIFDAHIEDYERLEGYFDPIESGVSMILGID